MNECVFCGWTGTAIVCPTCNTYKGLNPIEGNRLSTLSPSRSFTKEQQEQIARMEAEAEEPD